MNTVQANNVAVLWIRDGVLINRMHLNPVVFAVCYWICARPEKRSAFTFERLVNFGFEKSGASCADKMHLFNSEVVSAVDDVSVAASLYGELASAAGDFTAAFPGAENILKDLQSVGVKNFITSAVDQQILDQWAKGVQGAPLFTGLTEILGKRPNFAKGREHFEYIRERYGVSRLIYVADAVSELESAREFAELFDITAVGFGNVVSRSQVEDAFRLVRELALSRETFSAVQYILFNAKDVHLLDAVEIDQALYNAGADYVVAGEASIIMDNLRQYFHTNLGLL